MTKDFMSVISLLLYLGCQICPTKSLIEVTSTGSRDGHWTFDEGSVATLKCSITSYTQEMAWKLNTTSVAFCDPLKCNPLDTGDGTFLFAYDVSSASFSWAFNPVKTKYNGALIECVHSTVERFNFILVVVPKGRVKDDGDTVLTKVGAGFGITAFILVIVAFVVIAKLRCDCGNNSQSGTSLQSGTKNLQGQVLNKPADTLEKRSPSPTKPGDTKNDMPPRRKTPPNKTSGTKNLQEEVHNDTTSEGSSSAPKEHGVKQKELPALKKTPPNKTSGSVTLPRGIVHNDPDEKSAERSPVPTKPCDTKIDMQPRKNATP